MSINQSAIGVDLGSSTFVIAVAKKGGVEVVVNEASYRQTPCIVSYGNDRQSGDRATQKVKKELKNTIFYPTRLLGDITAERVQQEKPFNFGKLSVGDDQRAQFQVMYEGEQIKVTSEQAVAALFTEITAVLALNSIDSRGMVVSVPAFFTQAERQAVIDAATIAGVQIVKLYNESTATIMNYGIFRKADLSATAPRLVAFVDVGHSSSSIFFANIWNDRAELVLEVSDRTLGVRDIDLALLNHHAKQFEARHKIDLSDNPKAVYRLMEAIDRQRKVLTANTEAMLNVECLYEDIDFSSNTMREELEAMSAGVLQRIEKLLAEAVGAFGKEKMASLHSVERVGGGTRIPAVERLIAAAFGVQSVSKTLDANESIARGCAIQAAMLSPLFKVANFAIKEKLQVPVQVKLQYEGEEAKEKMLFDTGAEFCKNLSISIQKNAGLSVGLFANQRQIVDAFVSPMNAKEEKFEGKLFFILDKNGMALIDRAELRETTFVEEKVPTKKAEAKKTDGGKKNDAKKNDAVDPSKMDVEEEPKEGDDFTLEKKEKVRTTPIAIKVNSLAGLSGERLEAMKQLEKRVVQQEQSIKDTQNAKYALESFIYETRNKLGDAKNARFAAPHENEAILAALQQGENWLYSEGQSCDKPTYESHLGSMQKTAGSFYSRYKKIDDATEYLKDAVPAFKNFDQNNAELMAHGSPVQLNEIRQKVQEGLEHLQAIDALVGNYSIQSCDVFDLEAKKTAVNKDFEQLNTVLASIKREKETREREEKKKADDEKKKADDEKKKADGQQKKQENDNKTAQDKSKPGMDIETNNDQDNKMNEEKYQPGSQ